MKNRKRELAANVGNMDQIAFVRCSTLSGGRAEGMKVIDINNANGLSCTLLESRCLDISRLSYKGINLGFLAKPGLVSPQFCSSASGEFVHCFQAGMLYTCGLDNVGGHISTDDGELPTHGRLGISPCEDVNTIIDWDNEIIVITGSIYQSMLFGSNLVLKRCITIPIFGNEIRIDDSIENLGFIDEDIMLLYHINFGWPLLSEATSLEIAGTNVEPRDDEAKKGIDRWNSFEKPSSIYNEQVFYHTPKKGENGLARATVFNKELSLGVKIEFDPSQLPNLIEWKSMKSGDYALGIEPSITRVGGREEESRANRLMTVKAGEMKNFNISLTIVDENI